VDADDVIFSVFDFGVTWSFVIAAAAAIGALIAAVAAVAAAISARRSANTAEAARLTADEARFLGRWLVLRQSAGDIDPDTLEIPTRDVGPYYRIENVSQVTAFDVQLPFGGTTADGNDLRPGWREDLPHLEFAPLTKLKLTWVGSDGKRRYQVLKPGKQATSAPVWDERTDRIVHS
jgi:hypothetical protein